MGAGGASESGERAGRPPSFQEMWRHLAELGRNASTGGYRRYAWTVADAECRMWFREQALLRGLRYELDRNGNQWAWAGDPAAGGAVVTGSHLDSVPDGGAFDGPLGVVSGFAALDELRRRAGGSGRPAGGAAGGGSGSAPAGEFGRPLGIVNFADEEGARFGVACVGSRLTTGTLTTAQARALRDADGVSLPRAMEHAGRELEAGAASAAGGSAGGAGVFGPGGIVPDPQGIGPDPERLSRIAAFVELHIEQGRALAETPHRIGVASAIWPHGRWRFDFAGAADHAGTTRLEDRRDPMLTYANAVLAARKKARLAGALATFGRVAVEPNAVNAIPSLVSGWLDARAADGGTLDSVVEEIERAATERGRRDGVEVRVVRESATPLVEFDHGLRDRLVERLGGAPALPTGAGHDAGILSAYLPTAMLYVRNPTGVSHAPAEFATEDDCAAGVTALTDVLEGLACD